MSLRNQLKRIASLLPIRWQNRMKRMQFHYQIGRGSFVTDEAEFGMLSKWVSEGDWVLDIGANIGHYTCRLSELVGPCGRVISFEPVPDTFELLATNTLYLKHRNVSLVNAAASDSAALVGMSIPKFETGLDNYYMAHLSDDSAGLQILSLSIDGLALSGRVSLVKIDAEGHEMPVLRGMRELIERDRPVLIVEDQSAELAEYLGSAGYQYRRLGTSSNRIFEPTDVG